MQTMDSANRIQLLNEKRKLQLEIDDLKLRLQEKEQKLASLILKQNNHGLSKDEIARYSRQIIIPQLGLKGQEKLKKSSVLIVGCGGLGCPAAQYLAGSGVGKIGLVDYDEVELNNLHRQLLHDEKNIGSSKVESAAKALKRLNSSLIVETYATQLRSSNALKIISDYDVIVDASDNVATRYLVNDSCVLAGKPLVSGSAIQLEGHLTVYNHKNGPCYRCLFPQPPPPETVSNCGDAGVLGPVPGVIGVLQALQVILILTGNENILTSKLLLFDADESKFRTVSLRGKKENCAICGKEPTILKLIDYEQFCGAPASDKEHHVNLLKTEERISPNDLYKEFTKSGSQILIDVRSNQEFEMCKIPGSINIPMNNLSKEETLNEIKTIISNNIQEDSTLPVYVICRRGNDSQIAVDKLRQTFSTIAVQFKDVEGGLHAWAKTVDNSFPVY